MASNILHQNWLFPSSMNASSSSSHLPSPTAISPIICQWWPPNPAFPTFGVDKNNNNNSLQLEQQQLFSSIQVAALLWDQAKMVEKAAVQQCLAMEEVSSAAAAANVLGQQKSVLFERRPNVLNGEESKKYGKTSQQKMDPLTKNVVEHSPMQAKAVDAVESSKENDENNNNFLTRCGIKWKFLGTVQSERQFDALRRAHQVSKNRHVGYGVRYACTRNAKSRDNCPYLMLCIPNGPNGSLNVYYRNGHTHPIRQIRSRASCHMN